LTVCVARSVDAYGGTADGVRESVEAGEFVFLRRSLLKLGSPSGMPVLVPLPARAVARPPVPDGGLTL
jgi:hypothetical protein